MRRYPKETPESKLFDAVLGWLARLFAGRSIRKSVGRPVGSMIDRGYVISEWQKVSQAMGQGGESRFQQAVVTADKLLDYALKSIAPGETMGDRLKNAHFAFKSEDAYQAAWNGHKLRNRLVHELNYQTVSWEAQQAIRDFEKALRDLGVL